MRLRMLGTGASAAWPTPWCRRQAATADGVRRGQTSALLDGRVLLEIGAGAPRAALRAGRS